MQIKQIFLAVLIAHVSNIASAELVVVGTNEVDFGTHPAHEAKKTNFIIKNTGETVVNIIRVNKSCTCIETSCSKMQANPGEEIPVLVTVLPDSVYGYYRKNILVETTDPIARVIILSVTGTAMPLVNVRPSATIYAGRLPLKQEWVQKFELEASTSGVELGSVEHESNFPVKIEVVKLPLSNVLRWQLTLTLAPPLHAGNWQCKIKIPIRSPEGHPPIVIGVDAKIGNELFAVPQTVPIPLSTQPVVRVVRLRTSERNAVVHPNDVKVPPLHGLTFNIKKDPRDGTLVMTVTLTPEFVKLLFEKGKQDITVEVQEMTPATITFQPVGTPSSSNAGKTTP